MILKLDADRSEETTDDSQRASTDGESATGTGT
jgi:hypothetical protein